MSTQQAGLGRVAGQQVGRELGWTGQHGATQPGDCLVPEMGLCAHCPEVWVRVLSWVTWGIYPVLQKCTHTGTHILCAHGTPDTHPEFSTRAPGQIPADDTQGEHAQKTPDMYMP